MAPRRKHSASCCHATRGAIRLAEGHRGITAARRACSPGACSDSGGGAACSVSLLWRCRPRPAPGGRPSSDGSSVLPVCTVPPEKLGAECSGPARRHLDLGQPQPYPTPTGPACCRSARCRPKAGRRVQQPCAAAGRVRVGPRLTLPCVAQRRRPISARPLRRKHQGARARRAHACGAPPCARPTPPGIRPPGAEALRNRYT
jgi:hypothetical protein